jgi:hypothetical protein
MSDGLSQQSDLILEGPAVRTESSGRDWAGIGIGLASASALIAIFCAVVWALLVLIGASA